LKLVRQQVLGMLLLALAVFVTLLVRARHILFR
jgi:hypothetical protein